MSLFAIFFAGALLSLEPIEFRAQQALIVDSTGRPLFRSDKNFLLTVAGNTQGTVVSYDPQKRRVLISAHNSWWINCDQLQPQNVACADKPTRKTRSASLSDLAGPSEREGPDEMQGIPSCPGDPRCPSVR